LIAALEAWHAVGMSSSDLAVTNSLVIPGDELTVIAVRSSGPGGQNVNKVATKIELRFDLAGTTALTAAVKARLALICKGRLDADGRVIVTSEATRNRIQNLTKARDKLAALIREALVPPKPRHKTKPTRSSQMRRVEDKRRHAAVKRGRSVRSGDD
jgi:ribosome-associated protein